MPSQIVTTFGLYATAPTQIVLLMAPPTVFPRCVNPRRSVPAFNILKERHPQQRPSDELAQNVACWRHNSTCVRVAEEAFDAQMLRKRRTSASAHCCRGDADSDIPCGGFSFKHA